MKRNKLIETLEQVAPFSNEEKRLIFDVIELHQMQKGDFLIKCNEICTDIHFVIEGVVRFYIISKNGEELTTTFLSEGEFAIRIESFLTKSKSNGYLECETPCEFVSISRKNWDFLCENTKNFGYAMGQIGSVTLSNKMELQKRILSLEAKDAYHLFLKSYEDIADQISSKHISSFLGITPSSLSRIKKEITEI